MSKNVKILILHFKFYQYYCNMLVRDMVFAIFNDIMVDLKNSLEFIDTLDLSPNDKEILRELIPLLEESYVFSFEQSVIDAVVKVRGCVSGSYNIDYLLTFVYHIFRNAKKMELIVGIKL